MARGSFLVLSSSLIEDKEEAKKREKQKWVEGKGNAVLLFRSVRASGDTHPMQRRVGSAFRPAPRAEMTRKW
jgi:hypothetical protein